MSWTDEPGWWHHHIVRIFLGATHSTHYPLVLVSVEPHIGGFLNDPHRIPAFWRPRWTVGIPQILGAHRSASPEPMGDFYGGRWSSRRRAQSGGSDIKVREKRKMNPHPLFSDHFNFLFIIFIPRRGAILISFQA